jgi:ER degradation enhancer, mannosidase alpha-like 2
LAVDVANRLLPAFNTTTGMPYGTVNLMNGVPKDETPITCVAGIGTFLIEFGSLSRLTGDPIYENVAQRAIDSLYSHRSKLNLVGNHLNVQTGQWTGTDATIGSGVDSYFEYLVKAGILLNKPNLIEQFHKYQQSIELFLKNNDWYLWANMNSGERSLPLFASLDAFYPGVLTLVGDMEQAIKTIQVYHSLWRQFGGW